MAAKRKAPRSAWTKGQSGNPTGRPKDEFRIAELARSMSREAFDTLVEIMTDRAQPGQVRVRAAEAVLDRGLGKPAQTVTLHQKIAYDVLQQLPDVALLALAEGANPAEVLPS